MNGMPMLVTGLAWVVAVRTVMFCLDPYLKSISCSSWPSSSISMLRTENWL